MKKIYLFDLDSTVTKEEILPKISKKLNKENEMRNLTEMTMMGKIDFAKSFKMRVDMLSCVSIDEVASEVSKIAINEGILEFIANNKENCYIITSNLDVWIFDLMKKIGMENNFFSSKAKILNNSIIGIDHILSKEEIVKEFCEFTVAIGDGSNDKNMLLRANVGIAFGGVRDVAPSLLEVCDYAVYNEAQLCNLLNLIEKGDVDE